MSEYEAASLALQQAAITASYWRTGISLAVLSAVVLYGLRIMDQSPKPRRTRTTQQHTEAMTTAERRHTEVMEASEQRHTEAMKASEDRHIKAMKALQELIERTAAPK